MSALFRLNEKHVSIVPFIVAPLYVFGSGNVTTSLCILPRYNDYGNVFYKSYYIDNAEFRIYRDSNKFKLYVFQNNLMNWVCIGKFDNPRQVVREIEYIVSGKKKNDIRKWFDRDCIEIKYTK